MSKRKRILKKLYDVRPLKTDGSLDLEKIRRSGRIVWIEKKFLSEKKVAYQKFSDIKRSQEIFYSSYFFARKFKSKEKNQKEIRRPNAIHLGKVVPKEYISISKVYIPTVFSDKKEKKKKISNESFGREDGNFLNREIQEKLFKSSKKTKTLNDFEILRSIEDLLGFFKSKRNKKQKKLDRQCLKSQPFNILSTNFLFGNRFLPAFVFAAVVLIFSMIIPSLAFIQKGFETKKILTGSGENILGKLTEAKNNLASGQFEKASLNFEESREILNNANSEVSKIGDDLSQILRFIPGISKVATVNYILNAGESITLAGKTIADSLKSLTKIENPLNKEMNVSLTEIFLDLKNDVSLATENLKAANKSLSKASFSDLPPEIQPKFIELKEKLPIIISSLESFSADSNIILDVLGYNGPRKFLFLFQNNQEMRATGGFIGSYGILEVSNGRIKKLFVDDIYNSDGQLTARVIPPSPIQKMSAVWTMHDANWFPDFPTSAEKVAWFYEKTGGPTVDGIIAMTPTVIEKMLSVTGPIEMPEYGVTVNEDNFREITQYEVEVDYNKEENRPKKFIADLMPKILDELLSAKEPKVMLQTLSILNSALKGKHILIYSKNYNIQKLISKQGWSGEILDTDRDYLSVVNSNINGYKTDGVIKETIEHQAEIRDDGSIIDEVKITREHNGGNEKYDWWNKVNGDWMRVYVPEGSKLIEASGQTREFVSPPLDYQSLQFKKDTQIQRIEDETIIDEATGTTIYSENRKTVFANWVYVSPGETVVLKYKYYLPFKLSFDALHHPADSFSILYQKQSGSTGSDLVSTVKLPNNYKIIWKYPDFLETADNAIIFKTKLEKDKFVGLAVEKK